MFGIQKQGMNRVLHVFQFHCMMIITKNLHAICMSSPNQAGMFTIITCKEGSVAEPREKLKKTECIL